METLRWENNKTSANSIHPRKRKMREIFLDFPSTYGMLNSSLQTERIECSLNESDNFEFESFLWQNSSGQILILSWCYCITTTSTDLRNETHCGGVLHAWFIFNLHTKISLYLQIIAIFTRCTAFPPNPTPCITDKTTPLYLLGEPASLLVATNTHPPLSLVCQQLPHPLALASLALSHPTAQITLFT